MVKLEQKNHTAEEAIKKHNIHRKDGTRLDISFRQGVSGGWMRSLAPTSDT